jgi:hypothetical protein
MKKFILLMFIPFIGSGQIIIDATDMPAIGDVIPRKSDTLTILSGPGPSGVNQVWNMAQASFNVIQENTSVVAATSTPNGSSFPNATYAMTNDNANYLYFANSASSLSCLGFSGDLLNTGTPIAAQFSPDLTLHQFPRTYNSSFNDSYVIDVTIPGASINPLLSQIRFKRSSQVADITDGWGLLLTPGDKSYNTLRVHSTTTSIDSVWALPIFPPTWNLVSTDQSSSETYTWLAKGGKLAVAEMSFDTLGVPKIFKWTELPGIALNTNDLSIEHNFVVSPNPFQESLAVSVLDNYAGRRGEIHNVDGRVVATFSFTQPTVTIATESWPSGVYFIAIEGMPTPKKILKE